MSVCVCSCIIHFQFGCVFANFRFDIRFVYCFAGFCYWLYGYKPGVSQIIMSILIRYEIITLIRKSGANIRFCIASIVYMCAIYIQFICILPLCVCLPPPITWNKTIKRIKVKINALKMELYSILIGICKHTDTTHTHIEINPMAMMLICGWFRVKSLFLIFISTLTGWNQRVNQQ